MKLELAEWPVEQIRLGNRFAYERRVLDVDEGALLNLVLDDRRITDAALAIARPGEKVRITGIRDIVEPRTKLSGGNAFVDVMFTVRACERIGVKTTLVTYENGGKTGTDSAVLFYVPEANAVTSTGSLDRPVELPPRAGTIGPEDKIKIFLFPGAPPVPATDRLSLETRDVVIGGADI